MKEYLLNLIAENIRHLRIYLKKAEMNAAPSTWHSFNDDAEYWDGEINQTKHYIEEAESYKSRIEAMEFND